MGVLEPAPKFLVLLLAGASGCFTPDPNPQPELDETSSGSTAGATSATSSATSSSSGEGTEASATTDGTPAESGTSGDDTTSAPTGTDDTSSGTGETGMPFCGDGAVDDGEECDDGNDEDRDACSNACVAGFHTGSLEPCAEFGETVCGYFEAECRLDPDGELASLCYWPDAPTQDACDGTPGNWHEPDSEFAMDSGYDFPLAGACITNLGNLRCTIADAEACTEAGGDLCFREVAPGGEPLDEPNLCWWDVDEGDCAQTPGIWTTVDSGFGQGHPNALPPSDAAACLLQVPFL